jgi:hypothetical protein
MDDAFAYAVVQVGAEWKVLCRRKAIGHFRDRDQALAAASSLAAEAARAGRPAEVLVQLDTGELVSAWRHRNAH